MLIQWLNHCQDTMLPFFPKREGSSQVQCQVVGVVRYPRSLFLPRFFASFTGLIVGLVYSHLICLPFEEHWEQRGVLYLIRWILGTLR